MRGALPQVWVIELSSFQLDTAGDFEPTAAAVLNVTQDHLDWHGNMEAYAAAKARVFGKSAPDDPEPRGPAGDGDAAASRCG